MPPSASVSPSASSGNRPAAVAEAKRILGTYRPPAGATRLAHGPKGVLTSAALGSAATLDQVDDVQWWTVAGGGAKAIVAETVQPPGSTSGGSANDGTSEGGVEYGIAYGWPEITGVLTERTLEVSGTEHGGAAIIRVDAVVAWQLPRDPRSLVPATATVVTVTYQPGQLTAVRPLLLGPVTIADPTRVTAIIKVVNAAQAWPDGYRLACPFDGGQLMVVVFRAGAGGPVVATAKISPSGCQPIHLTVAGGANAMLTKGHDMAAAIGTVIDEPWPTS